MVVKTFKIQFKRTITLISWWVLIAVGFGFLYLYLPGHLINSRTGETITNIWDSIYFSFVTILTIGYGDISAVGFIRALTAIEGLIGWVLFGVIVYKVVSFKQDMVLKEIHNLSNEQYLSRVRNALFISNTNLARFIKDSQSKKISKDVLSYELSIISTTLRSNIEDVRRFLIRNKHSVESDISEEEIFLLVKGIKLCIANFIGSLKVLPQNSFEKEPILYDNVTRIAEAGKSIYNFCNMKFNSRRIDELKDLYTQLEEYWRKQ
jgi:potassium channel LctB